MSSTTCVSMGRWRCHMAGSCHWHCLGTLPPAHEHHHHHYFYYRLQHVFFIYYYNNNNDHTERPNSKLLQSPHCAANHLQHIRSIGLGAIVGKSHATHQALFMCNMCATWCEGTAQLLSLTDFQMRLLQLFILLAETTNQWRRGGNQSTRRKPWQRALENATYYSPKNSSPNRDSNLHSSIGSRLGKQTC